MPFGSFRLNTLGALMAASGPTLTTWGLSSVKDNTNDYPTTITSDAFGTGLACNETYYAVSATGEDDASNINIGVVYVYNWSDNALVYTLRDPNLYGTSASDAFGSRIAMSDNYLIAAATAEDDVGGTSSGAAYVYDLSDGSLLYSFANPNNYSTSMSDSFGSSVAITDTHAIVGANTEDSVDGTSSGVAYVYNLSNGSLLYTLVNPNVYGTMASDQFGQAVAINNTYAIVGAYAEDDATGANSGAVYFFNLSDGSLARTKISPNIHGTTTNDFYGYSLAVKNDKLLIGTSESDAGGAQSGKAIYYDITTDTNIYTFSNPNYYSTSANDQFAQFVALSSTHALISANNEDEGVQNASGGVAYMFELSTGNLVKTIPNTNYFGIATGDGFAQNPPALSENYAVIGAPAEDVYGGNLSSGIAYVYSNILGKTLPDLTGVSIVANAQASASNTITLPADIQDGDYCFLFDRAVSATTAPTTVLPTDFQLINTASLASTVAINSTISVKKLKSTDSNTTITGMGAGTNIRKIALIVRGTNTPIRGIWFPKVVNSQSSLTALTNQTISLASSTQVPLIAFAHYASSGTGISGGFTGQTATGTVTSGSAYNIARYFVSNTQPSASNITVTMADFGTNTLQSFYVYFY